MTPTLSLQGRTALITGSSKGIGFALAGALASGRLVDLTPQQPLDVALHWHAWNLDTPYTRAVGRYGPMNQLAFVVWASLVPPLPFLGLSAWLEGPDAMLQALHAQCRLLHRQACAGLHRIQNQRG